MSSIQVLVINFFGFYFEWERVICLWQKVSIVEGIFNNLKKNNILLMAGKI